MPRLFTGLEIPAEVVGRLSAFSGGLPGARWIDEDDLHITLRFFGDVDIDTANAVHALLEEARPRALLPIELDGLAIFGGAKPRAVYVSVASNPELADLQAEHERIARHAGLDPEPRKFTPHVTLARLNRSTGPEAVAHYLGQAGVFSRVSFTAERTALFSARASRGGGPYVVETVYPFVPGQK